MQTPGGRRYRIGFVIEYSIGHVTFAHMLQRVVAADPSVDASWFFVEPVQGDSVLGKYWSPFNNYTLRASWHGRRMVGTGQGFDAFLLHTQTLSLLFARLMRRVPTVISTDATPENIDEVGTGYMHRVQSPRAEGLKRRLFRSIYGRAAFTMPWNDWAARSMVDNYGVDPRRCRVVRPGLDVRSWPRREHPSAWSSSGPGSGAPLPSGPLRLLFVGGDFERKGGKDLLAALEMVGTDWQLDIVTKSEVQVPAPRARVHSDLAQGDPRLRQLFYDADVFVLPTIGDAMPWALIEAMCAGVPCISTSVGAVPEMVVHGETGLLVSAGDPRGLAYAIDRLAGEPQERGRMALAARTRAESYYDEAVNGPAVLELLKSAARRAPA